MRSGRNLISTRPWRRTLLSADIHGATPTLLGAVGVVVCRTRLDARRCASRARPLEVVTGTLGPSALGITIADQIVERAFTLKKNMGP